MFYNVISIFEFTETEKKNEPSEYKPYHRSSTPYHLIVS